MKNVKVKLDYKGIGDILKSEEMAKCVDGEADRMIRELGEGYGKRTKNMGTRQVSVFTVTSESAKENIKNNTLLKHIRKQGKER